MHYPPYHKDNANPNKQSYIKQKVNMSRAKSDKTNKYLF